jgi:hypothetical protein
MGGEYKDDILHGRVATDISHAGESIDDDTAAENSQTLLEKLCAHHKYVSFKLFFLNSVGEDFLPSLAHCFHAGAIHANETPGPSFWSMGLRRR